jgi:hypothetical protein
MAVLNPKGFEVFMSDTPSDDRPSDDTPSDDTPPTAGEPASSSTDDAPETVIDLSDADESKPRDIQPWKLVVVVVVVVIVAMGGLLAYHYRNKIFKRSTSTPTAATTPAGAAPGRVEDTFQRPDGDLGSVSTGGEKWQQVVGKWGVSKNEAYVATPNDKGPRNIAVVDLKSGDGSVQAKAAKLADGWSLLFRYQNPGAYWRIYWDADRKAFHLTKYENNRETNAVPGGFIAPNAKEGMQVKVEFQGPTITVIVDGAAIRTVSDSYLQDQTKMGMMVETPGAPTARWENFVATTDIPQPLKTAPPAPSTTNTP